MLRLKHDQPSLWESILPPELFQVNEELAEVDRLLDDERFFAGFKGSFLHQNGKTVRSRGHVPEDDEVFISNHVEAALADMVQSLITLTTKVADPFRVAGHNLNWDPALS